MPKVQLNDEALRIERARRNWPWFKIAAAADIAPTSLSAMRHGHKEITAAVISRLERALDLPTGALHAQDAADATTPGGPATEQNA